MIRKTERMRKFKRTKIKEEQEEAQLRGKGRRGRKE